MTTWIFTTSEISNLITYLSLSFQHSSPFLYCSFFGCLLLLFPLSFLLDSLESFFLFLQTEYVLIYCWQEGTPGISTAGKPQHETVHMWLWQKNAKAIHKHTNKFIKTWHKIPIQVQQVDKTLSAVGEKIETKICTAQAECLKESLAMFYITSVGIENKKHMNINYSLLDDIRNITSLWNRGHVQYHKCEHVAFLNKPIQLTLQVNYVSSRYKCTILRIHKPATYLTECHEIMSLILCL